MNRSTASKSHFQCLVVGAGISGLMAARTLREAGIDTLIIDKARGVGGRMATRRDGDRRFDHGAPGFHIHSAEFRDMAEEWINQGVAKKWQANRAGATNDITYYCGREGMTSIAKYLALGLNIKLNCRLSGLYRENGKWAALTTGGETILAEAVIMTPPIPQVLDILKAGQISLPVEILSILAQISYSQCLAVMAEVDGDIRIPDQGLVYSRTGSEITLIDNHKKGISPQNGAVTILASPEFSREHWDKAEEMIIGTLYLAAGEYLSGPLVSARLHRWRYSRCEVKYPESFLLLNSPGLMTMAGDGFAGLDIDGAALSGIAAAKAILDRIG